MEGWETISAAALTLLTLKQLDCVYTKWFSGNVWMTLSPNWNKWMNFKGSPCFTILYRCDASRTDLRLCLWNPSYVLYTSWSLTIVAPMCQLCCCKEPISFCKVLCFDNVRSSPEFMVTFGPGSLWLQKYKNVTEGRTMCHVVKERGTEVRATNSR